MGDLRLTTGPYLLRICYFLVESSWGQSLWEIQTIEGTINNLYNIAVYIDLKHTKTAVMWRETCPLAFCRGCVVYVYSCDCHLQKCASGNLSFCLCCCYFWSVRFSLPFLIHWSIKKILHTVQIFIWMSNFSLVKKVFLWAFFMNISVTCHVLEEDSLVHRNL